jgi:hypothetical protein
MGLTLVIPAMSGGGVRGHGVELHPLGKTQDPFKKITKAKRTGNMAQVKEHPSRKCKTLNSNPSTSRQGAKREREREREREGGRRKGEKRRGRERERR